MEQFTPSLPKGKIRMPETAVRGGTQRNLRNTAVAGTQLKPASALSREEKNAVRADKVRNFSSLPFTLQLVLLPSMLLRLVGLRKLSAPLRAIGHMTATVPGHVSVSEIASLPRYMAQSAADQFKLTGYSDARVAKINRAADKLDTHAGKVAARIGTPMKQRMHGVIDRATEGKSGGWLSRRLEKFAQKRHLANLKQSEEAAASLGKIAEGLTGHGGQFSELTRLAQHNVEGMGAAHRATHFENISHAFDRLSLENAPAKITEALRDVKTTALQGKRAALAAEAHGSAVGKGLGELVKNAAHYAGRTPILTAMLGVGTVAAGASAYFTTRHANNVGAQALADMTRDIGDANHPYLVEAQKTYRKDKQGRWLTAGLTTASEGVMTATMGMGGHAGTAAFMGVAALPMAAQALVKDNPLLNAYANLQKAEKGELQVTPADKITLVRQLVANVPQVAAQGGYYNRLASPVAAKLVEQKLSLREIMQTITTESKFAPLAAEAKQVLDARQAASHAQGTQAKVKEIPTAANENIKVANDNTLAGDGVKGPVDMMLSPREKFADMADAQADAEKATDDARMKAALGVPKLQIQASQSRHDGMVLDRQMERAQ